MGTQAERLAAELATLKLTKIQLAEVQAFKQQVVQLGCALLPVLPEEEVRAEVFALTRPAWVKICRGNPDLEKAYPKVVRFAEDLLRSELEDLLEPLFAASRAVERATR